MLQLQQSFESDEESQELEVDTDNVHKCDKNSLNTIDEETDPLEVAIVCCSTKCIFVNEYVVLIMKIANYTDCN